MKNLFLIALLTFTLGTSSLADNPKRTEVALTEINPDAQVNPTIITTKPTTPRPDDATLSKLRFRLGESIVFHAFHETWVSRVNVGSCTMSIGKDLHHINGFWAVYFKLTAKSAKWFERLYPIKDVVEGFFEVDTNRTIFLRLDKREHSYYQTMDIVFDYQKNIVFEKDSTKGKVKYHQYQLTQDVVDAYSIIYLIRKKDLIKDAMIDYTIYSGGKTHEMDATVLEDKALVTLNKKPFETFRVKLLTKVEGALEQKGGIFIHFLKDAWQTPIYIAADVKIGKFVLEADKSALP